MSLYQRMIDAGVPVDNHESDLYFLATADAWKVYNAAKAAGEVHSAATTFVSQVDGKLWAHAPFMYTPFWDAKRAKRAKDSEIHS